MRARFDERRLRAPHRPGRKPDEWLAQDHPGRDDGLLALQRRAGNCSVTAGLAGAAQLVQRSKTTKTPIGKVVDDVLDETRGKSPKFTAVTRGKDNPLDETDQDYLKESIGTARRWINKALTWSTRENISANGSFVGAHFGTGRAKDRKKAETKVHERIQSVLTRCQTGLGKSQQIVDLRPSEQRKGNVAGYVSGVSGRMPWERSASGRIHVRFSTLADTDATADTIVHEATHKFAFTDDKAYRNESAYDRLDVDRAVKNADSYAAFVEKVAKHR